MIQNILGRVLYLAPTTWMDLPGPSFTETVMQQIKDLSPPYVGGNDWAERRKQICEKPGNDVLCAHPFMAKDLEGFITVKEWEMLQ
jgi:hypothetical protein